MKKNIVEIKYSQTKNPLKKNSEEKANHKHLCYKCIKIYIYIYIKKKKKNLFRIHNKGN